MRPAQLLARAAPNPDRPFRRYGNSVAAAYLGDCPLALEGARNIQPVIGNRHEAGVECVVRKIQFGRDTVRLVFASASGIDSYQDPLTSLTVKWPVPLSKSLTERDPIENLIRRFVEIKQTP